MLIPIILIVVAIGVASTYFLTAKHFKQRDVVLARHLEKWKNDGTMPSLTDDEHAKMLNLVENLISQPKEETITSSERLQEKDQKDDLKLQLNNMLIVNELGERLTSSLHLKETFDHLYKTLNSMMDAGVVELSVRENGQDKWSIFSNLETVEGTDYYNHIAEWGCINKRTVMLDDVQKDFGRYVNKPLVLSNGKPVQSLISFPIEQDDNIIGSITVMSFRTSAFDQYHIDSIEHLLRFIAVAMQNAVTHNKLDQLRIRAEESEKHEQQFLANMSHEIRTPMNAVLGMTNLLLDTKMDERQLKYLTAINTSSKNLLVIINDILDLSKMEAGKMEIETIPFRMHEVIDNVFETNRVKAEESGLRFAANVDPTLPAIVKGDPTRLNQILTNLCSNAIKFTERGSVTINVSKQANGKYIKFSVKDTGIGIPEDKLHLLFSNFKQVDSSTYRKYGGTGLGLSISKTLIELQGGTVDVKSSHGQGSEFIVSIPFEEASTEEINAMAESKTHDYSGLDGIRILVAEDNEYNQIVVNDTLEVLIKNVSIDIAENGLIALEKQEANEYDIILMDAQMPEMDGLEATRRIRALKDDKKSKIPIIALTASVHKADIDKCFVVGMNGFVPKPFTREELLDTLADFYHNPDGSKIDNQPSAQKEPTESPKLMSDNGMVTDMTFLREFAEGDEKRMVKYIGLYLKLLPANLEKIKDAVANASNEDLVKVIHGMRPHLNYMGMKNSAELAAGIEANVHEGKNLDQLSNMAGTVIEECVKSQTELNETLASLGQ